PGWMKAGVAVMARVAPGPTARLAHRLFRRPAVARRFDTGDRAMLEIAEAIIATGEEVWADTPSGRMRAYRFRPEGDPVARVLLLHGWTADARAMGAFVEPLRAAGMEALIPDLPAHGGSDGDETDAPASGRATKALMEALDFAPDYMIGHSFGGGVAGVLATLGVVPKRAAAIASPCRLRRITDDFIAAFGLPESAATRFEKLVAETSGWPIDDLDGYRIWPDKPTEMLVLHAPDDEEVDYAEALDLEKLPNATLTPMPGLGHRKIVYDDASVGAAIAFITQ
ncbi:MAG: alpha/beta fold hydrolase, partial [Pseudomonadota bacterium]